MGAVTAKGRKCPDCENTVRVKKDGSLWKHLCAAPGQDCPTCGHWVYGKECGQDGCGWVGAVSDPAPTVDSMDDTKTGDEFESAGGPAADEFESAEAVKPEQKTNVSGQPEPARDQWGRYLLPNPATGLYSDDKLMAGRRNGWTRATTFAKSAADTYALTRYDERLTLIGATLRPDIVARAHGKDVRENKTELNNLVTQVKDAAGAKVAANIGTAVHGFTELVDAGLCDPEAVPTDYVPHVASYLAELDRNGLEPVHGLIERTTFVNEWGGIAGTFDRVLYHRPTNTYVIGDLKTGRDLSYGRMEIAVQLALYAHGLNAHGVFNWVTGEWEAVTPVRTDFGVVMHLPIQGDDAGKCTLKRVNLAAGWDAARVCGDVMSSRKRKDYMDDGFVLPQAPYMPELPVERPAEPVTDWDLLFSSVASSEEASVFWQAAKAAGITGIELNRLVGLAQDALRVK